MRSTTNLPFPVLDALPLGAHRLSVLTDEALFASCNVRIAFTQRSGGVSVGPYESLNCSSVVDDDEQAVRRNRALVREALGAADAPCVMLEQVHGTQVDVVDRQLEEDAFLAQADGVVIAEPGVSALLLSADCLLFIVVSPSGRFCIAHAGWRGAADHIARTAIRELEHVDQFPAHAYNAYLGPHICASCFEVGADVEDRFRREFGDAVLPSPRHVDLSAAVKTDALAMGMDERRIVDSGACTVCASDTYYSYRASGGTCGRMAAGAHWFGEGGLS